jgi:hypothetical protein
MAFCAQAAVRALVKFGLCSVRDNPLSNVNLAAQLAGSEGKQLAVTDHLFTGNHRAAYHALEVVFAVSIAGIREQDRLAVAGSEILDVCHFCAPHFLYIKLLN